MPLPLVPRKIPRTSHHDVWLSKIHSHVPPLCFKHSLESPAQNSSIFPVRRVHFCVVPLLLLGVKGLQPSLFY